jgi:predicted amidophosphoribosyltransferase
MAEAASNTSRPRGPLARLLDLVWPPKCAGCDRLRHTAGLRLHPVFCRLCRPTVAALPPRNCHTCAEPAPYAFPGDSPLCLRCLQHPPAQDRARAQWLYEGAVSDALQAAKYRGEVWRLERLATGFARWLEPTLDGPTSAVAVPAHPKDLGGPGFHAADLLLRLTARSVPNLRPDWRLLRKIQRTAPQASLPLETRRDNVQGVFAAHPHRTRDRDWLLVDDVITTGATISAAGSALKSAGARSVTVATLARAGHAA